MILHGYVWRHLAINRVAKKMHEFLRQTLHKLRWKAILALGSTALLSGWLLVVLFPYYRNLVLFGLYSIPSHLLISPFPHEPVLLQAAKFFSPLWISVAGIIGCCTAGFLDYWIISPLINNYKVRPKLDNTRLFRKSLQYFFKYPFAILVVAAISPVPFYPFKFLSIAGHYSLWKYQAALILGRMPRYYVLALMGQELQVSTWVLLVAFVLIVLSPFLKKLLGYLKNSIWPMPKELTLPESGEQLEDLPEYREWASCRQNKESE